MTATISQTDAILAILRTRPQGITPMEALQEVGCFRLAARIADLKADGYVINTVLDKVDGKAFARYQLVLPAPVPETEQRALWGDR